MILPLATFLLSLAVGGVALMQWLVARNKLRLDLFDRRYKVFAATREFLSVIQTPSFDMAELRRFNLAVADAEFLFGSDVVVWLEEIRKTAVHLRTTSTFLSQQPHDDELAKLAKAQEDDLLWVVDATNSLTKVFVPYLGFAHIK